MIQNMTEFKNSYLMGAGLVLAVLLVALFFAFRGYAKANTRGKKVGYIALAVALIGTAVLGGIQVNNDYNYKLWVHEKEVFYTEYASNLETEFEVEYGDTTFTLNEYDEELFVEAQVEEVDVMSVGEQLYTKTLVDKDDYKTEIDYKVTVQDTQAPAIKNVKDKSITVGTKFAIEDMKITAEDPVDGELEVEIKGEVNVDKAGKYTIEVSAEDVNGNVTTESFNVEVKPKPVVKQPASTGKITAYKNSQPVTKTSTDSSETKQWIPDYKTITFHNTGRTVYYYNAGMANGQSQIDRYPATATTWDIGPHALTHSNTDGRPTYLAGHYYNAFKSVTTMKVGDIITIRDGNGHVQSYEATSRYLIDVTPNGRGTVNGSASAMAKIRAFTGEGIMLQTCVAGDTTLMIVAELRPMQ